MPKKTTKDVSQFPLNKKEELFLYKIAEKISENCKELKCDLWYGKIEFKFKKKASVFNEE